MRTLQGFQRHGFQNNAFQMPDLVTGSGGWTPWFWLQMQLRAQRRKLEEERQERREQEEATAAMQAFTALRFVAVPSQPRVIDIIARLRARNVLDTAAELDDFFALMQMIAEVDE